MAPSWYDVIIAAGVMMALGLIVQVAGCVSALRVVTSISKADADHQVTVRRGAYTVFWVVAGFSAMLAVMFVLWTWFPRVMPVVTAVLPFLSVYGLLKYAFRSWPVRVLVSVLQLSLFTGWLIDRNWITSSLLGLCIVFNGMVGMSLIIQESPKVRRLLLPLPSWLFLMVGFAVYDLLHVFWSGLMTRYADKVVQAEAPSTITVPDLTPTLPAVPDAPVQTSWLEQVIANPPIMILGLGDILLPGLLFVVLALWARHYKRPSLVLMPFAGIAAGALVAFIVLWITRHPQPAIPYLFSGMAAGLLIAAGRAQLVRRLLAIKLREEPQIAAT